MSVVYRGTLFMALYTVQLSQWRKVKAQGITLVDTTVKSGVPVFAPSWDIVMASKSGEITSNQYIERYLAMLEQRHRDDPLSFSHLVQDCTEDDIAIACYCKAGKFCHRHLLVNFLQGKFEIDYRGEIE